MKSNLPNRKENNMSTNDPANGSVTLKRKYDVFDENFVEVSKEVTVTFTPAVTYEEAVQRLNSDTAKILTGCNMVLRREALNEARKNAGVGEGVINRAVLMEFIKPYRELPQFAKFVASSDKRKATAEEWDAQTKAILEQVKTAPFMVQAIKDASAKANADEE